MILSSCVFAFVCLVCSVQCAAAERELEYLFAQLEVIARAKPAPSTTASAASVALSKKILEYQKRWNETEKTVASSKQRLGVAIDLIISGESPALRAFTDAQKELNSKGDLLSLISSLGADGTVADGIKKVKDEIEVLKKEKAQKDLFAKVPGKIGDDAKKEIERLDIKIGQKNAVLRILEDNKLKSKDDITKLAEDSREEAEKKIKTAKIAVEKFHADLLNDYRGALCGRANELHVLWGKIQEEIKNFTGTDTCPNVPPKYLIEKLPDSSKTLDAMKYALKDALGKIGITADFSSIVCPTISTVSPCTKDPTASTESPKESTEDLLKKAIAARAAPYEEDDEEAGEGEGF